MLRKATPQDVPALEAFLARRATSSMFLRGNLAAHGTQEQCHHHGTTFFLKEAAGAIIAVVGCSNGGYLMCQAPDQGVRFWQEVCACLKGRSIHGITGDPEQTAAWCDALGLVSDDFSINEVTPLYHLKLRDVGAVDPTFRLRGPVPADLEMLTHWYEGFHRGTGLTLAGDTTNADVARRFINDLDARILIVGGMPVAMTKLNAKAVDMVQIGGVYVPPKHRGHGYGGDVVALHLAELARNGMRSAVLFAASDYAAQAYERIGFQHVGGYRVAMFNSPRVVGAQGAELNSGEK